MFPKRVFLLVCIFIISLNAFAKDNVTTIFYCNDKETIMEYEALIQKYLNDPNAHILHALWLGLCINKQRGFNNTRG